LVEITGWSGVCVIGGNDAAILSKVKPIGAAERLLPMRGGTGLGSKRLIGFLGERTELGKLAKMDDWNE
jgi:hypothetical protein